MRRAVKRRGSVISQLLIAFCVFAVIIAVATAVGYTAVSHQDAATSQVKDRYSLLQEANGKAAAAFSTAHLSVLYYAATGQHDYLWELGPAQVDFGSQMAILRRNVTPGLRGLISAQASTAADWFELEPRILAAKPDSAAARALLRQSQNLAVNFIAANTATGDTLHGDIGRLTAASSHSLGSGLTRSALALGAAVLLILAASLSTLYTITRPLRGLTATVRRLTAGDHAARANVAGSAEVREVAEAVNVLADESDRLRDAEAEANRLRARAREAGVRIRQHLAAEEVLGEARAALEGDLNADIVYLRLLEDGRLGPPAGYHPEGPFSSGIVQHLSGGAVEELRALFQAQKSSVVQDVQGKEGETITAEIRAPLRKAGVASMIVTPFGVGTEMIGIIAAYRLRGRPPWSAAEIDAVESIAADLGRGLNHARLYEAEERLVEDLKALDRTRSDFFATVSHELRAPLTTIEGYWEILRDGEAGPVTPAQRKILDTIDRSNVRLRDLIEDLFTLAKLESDALPPVTSPVSLPAVIEAATEAIQPSAAAAGLTVASSVAATELLVGGDAGQLERVMINLLSNAVKFTPKGGQVEVCAGADGEDAVIRVVDTGIGIPEHDQSDLFKRFFRAANATQRSIPGTGLGLVIVRTIVAKHNGVVELQSREGAGTTVTVRLPLLASLAELTR